MCAGWASPPGKRELRSLWIRAVCELLGRPNSSFVMLATLPPSGAKIAASTIQTAITIQLERRLGNRRRKRLTAGTLGHRPSEARHVVARSEDAGPGSAEDEQ